MNGFAIEQRAVRVLTYNQRAFPFAELARQIFNIRELAQLRSSVPVARLKRETDQSTDLHRRFYERCDPLLAVFEAFIAEHVAPVYDEPFCYQRVPTFRVQLPDNVAVGEFHVDSEYHHPDGECNFWLPLTSCWGSNSLWIERHQGQHDYAPVTLEPGEYLVFDAVHLSHGNVINDTGCARLSIDFRCVLLSKLPTTSARSVFHGVPLTVDGYYKLFQPGSTVKHEVRRER